MQGLNRRSYFEARADGTVWRVSEAQLGKQGGWSRTHDRQIAGSVDEFRRRWPDLANHIQNYSAIQAEEEKVTADGVASIINRLSAEERDKLVRVLAGPGVAEVVAGGTPLPEDFPSRPILISAGYNTLEKIAGAQPADLRAVKGLGTSRLRAVMVALDEALAPEDEAGYIQEDEAEADAIAFAEVDSDDVDIEDGDLKF